MSEVKPWSKCSIASFIVYAGGFIPFGMCTFGVLLPVLMLAGAVLAVMGYMETKPVRRDGDEIGEFDMEAPMRGRAFATATFLLVGITALALLWMAAKV